jgi:hypothetical protein
VTHVSVAVTAFSLYSTKSSRRKAPSMMTADYSSRTPKKRDEVELVSLI